MAWFGAGAAAIGAVGALGANMQSASSANQMSGMSRDFARDMRDTQIWATVRDMKRSGINPMLAVRGMNAGSGTSAAAIQPNFENVGSAAIGGLHAAAQAEVAMEQRHNVKADTENKGAQKDLLNAQTVQAYASAGMLDARMDEIRQEMTSFSERLRKIGFEADKAGWESKYAQYAAGKMSSEDLMAARYYTARAEKMEHEAKLLGLKVPEAIAEAAFWRSNFGQWYPGMHRGLGLVKDAATGAASIYGAGKLGGALGRGITPRMEPGGNPNGFPGQPKWYRNYND